LKPSNGAVSRHLRKKLKLPSPYSGKENPLVAGGTASAGRVAAVTAAAAETLAAGSRGGAGLRRVPEDKEATGGENCSLLRSGSGDTKLGATEKKGVLGYEGCKVSSSCFPNSRAYGDLEPGENYDLGVAQCKEAQGVSRASNPVPGEGVIGGRSGPGRHDPASNEENVDAKAEAAARPEAENNERSGSAVDDGNYHSHSIESELLVSSSKYHFDGADCKVFQEPGLGTCSLVSEERKVVAENVATSKSEPPEKKSCSTADSVESQCLNSVESVLLESRTVHHFEDGDCDDFEIGTQLNELINLCMRDQVDSHRNSRASPGEGKKMDSGRFESVCKVQCPLCGSDISDLSEELQLAHTNNCLDKDEPAKVI
jgi:DNA cross-link repair 1A protein